MNASMTQYSVYSQWNYSGNDHRHNLWRESESSLKLQASVSVTVIAWKLAINPTVHSNPFDILSDLATY